MYKLMVVKTSIYWAAIKEGLVWQVIKNDHENCFALESGFHWYILLINSKYEHSVLHAMCENMKNSFCSKTTDNYLKQYCLADSRNKYKPHQIFKTKLLLTAHTSNVS